MFVNDEYVDIKIDDKIADMFVSTNLFKNIEPNTITITGIVLNIILYNYFIRNNFKSKIVNILLIIRFLCDIFDGAVARKYNKLSDLGGFLDTVNDLMFIQIYIFILFNKIFKNKIIIFLLLLGTTFLNLFVMRNSMIDHSILKDTSQKNKIDKLIAFACNNTIFLFIGIVIFNNRFIHYLKPLF